MNIFYIGIGLFLLGSFFAILCNNKIKVTILSLFHFFATIFCVIPALKVITSGSTISQTFNLMPTFGAVNFVLDPLSAFFIVVIAVMSLISTIYAKGYLSPYIEKGKNINSHLIFLTTLIVSMMLVVTCQNALMFLICWEIMSLSSFFLVIFEGENHEILKAGIKYLVFMHFSVLFLIIAFALMVNATGSYNFADFATLLSQNKHLANIIFLIAFVGFGTKAGFSPFHNWLPDAHPAAPSHVSAIMSGVMIKTGLYGILRILSFISTPSKVISYFVLVISLVSALYGVLYAITQHDLKRLLAYHSIENIGIIGMGIGVGMLGLAYNNPIVATLGFAGGILHILNHSIFKELLFLSAGSVYLKTHTRDIESLGGLIKFMPKTAILFLIGSIAICGLPPFNGFVSEILIYFGMFKGLAIHNFFSVITLLLGIAGLALIGTMAILCFTKAFSIIFLGKPRSEAAEHVQSESPKSMIIPMAFLATLTLLIGLFPQFVFKLLLNPVHCFVKADVINLSNFTDITSLMQTLSIYSFALVAFLSLLICIKSFMNRGKINYQETWGCGYNKGNNHVQYTASSYASPFLSMLKPLFKKVFDIEKPKNLFPKKAHFNLRIDDIEESYIIKPIVKIDEEFLSKFESIQDGNIQSYIRYGLIFLVIVLIGALIIC